MMKHHLCPLLISINLNVHRARQRLSLLKLSDLRGSLRSSASAVRTLGDVQAFVQCAYEYVQEEGFEEARRAFNEDVRWKSGEIYISVDEVTPETMSLLDGFVFPPDPSREGLLAWGLQIDRLLGVNDGFTEGTASHHEAIVGEGWMYYSFHEPRDRQG